jgi:hypothetical protein
MRLDEDKLEALRDWGEGLQRASSEELAAAGRAILMLSEEIDQLHIELWHARLRESAREPAPEGETAGEEEERVPSSLHARLQRALGRHSDSLSTEPVEKRETGSEGDSATSPEAWIEGMRRQE